MDDIISRICLMLKSVFSSSPSCLLYWMTPSIWLFLSIIYFGLSRLRSPPNIFWQGFDTGCKLCLICVSSCVEFSKLKNYTSDQVRSLHVLFHEIFCLNVISISYIGVVHFTCSCCCYRYWLFRFAWETNLKQSHSIARDAEAEAQQWETCGNVLFSTPVSLCCVLCVVHRIPFYSITRLPSGTVVLLSQNSYYTRFLLVFKEIKEWGENQCSVITSFCL